MTDRPGDTCLTDQKTVLCIYTHGTCNTSDRLGDTQHVWQTRRHTSGKPGDTQHFWQTRRHNMSDRSEDTQHVWLTRRQYCVYTHRTHISDLTDQETHNMSDRPGDTQHVWQIRRQHCVYTHTDHPACQEQCGVTARGLYVHTDTRSTVQRYTAEGAGRDHHANSKTSLRLGADHIAPLPGCCWTAGKLILQQCTYIIKCTTLHQSLTLKYKDRKGSELHLKTGNCGVIYRWLGRFEHLKTCDCGCYKYLKWIVYGVKHLKQVTLGLDI